MKRLTMWYDGNQAICENEECSLSDCPFADPICEQVQSIIDRLALIEDILGDDYDLDRLRELVEMDKANSVPPCQIGDVFYAIDWSRWGSEVKEYRISMLQQKRDKAWRIRAKDTQSHHQVDWAYDDYREQAYSTHEAAEAALKAREQNG